MDGMCRVTDRKKMTRKTRWGLAYFSLVLFSRRPYAYDFRFPTGHVEDRSHSTENNSGH